MDQKYDQNVIPNVGSIDFISMVDHLLGMHTECVDVHQTQPNRHHRVESCNNSPINKTYTICNYYDCFELEITWP